VRVDRLADAAWRSKAAPFDAVTLSTPSIETADLVAAAANVVDLLEAEFPSAVIHTAEDWLEHDGFVTEPELATWSDLRAAVRNSGALIEASPLDTYVRRAWLGESAFYLRWHYYDEADSPFAADPPAGGDLDVTADAQVVATAMRHLAAVGIDTTTHQADAFFAQRWNG
jgi:hypothetical protein